MESRLPVYFAASYSGGKDSILALHRLINDGMTPKALITTYDGNKSNFHSLPPELLKAAAKAMNIPLNLVNTADKDYNKAFEDKLLEFKSEGIGYCCFGDIDITPHRKWGEDRADAADMTALFPLWQQSRRALVEELINLGYRAYINVVNTKLLSEDFLGKELTLELLSEIEAYGADPCGENGEYHSFVFDGPIFSGDVKFTAGETVKSDHYRIIPLSLLAKG